MKPKAILFFVGLLVLILGAAPLVANLIPATAQWLNNLPKAGSIVYQLILTIIGIVAIGHSMKRHKVQHAQQK